MPKLITYFCYLVLLTLILLCKAPFTFAQTNSYISIVNPVRGNDFWEEKNQVPETAVIEQLALLRRANLQATFLVRFDALSNPIIREALKNSPDEKGIFLEVTPSWTRSSGVDYHQSAVWHNAGSIFLTGYTQQDREKLIDNTFLQFKEVFGYYPRSVGAWWIDSYSLEYMRKKYQIEGGLIVADQYSTDNYQIWGQYWSTPYYPFHRNTLIPAKTKETKIPVVIMQWAARDPFNGYGKGVEESTYSVQPNDYLDYHKLDTRYFNSLIDSYLNQKFNQFAHLVIGLENSYSWNKYNNEYENQIKTLVDKQALGKIKILTMSDFANWYKRKFPDISPEQIIVSGDPLKNSISGLSQDYQVIWFMNSFYRAGLFYNNQGISFRDIRQYIDGEEPCYQKVCDELNFATFATRVLDDVTFHQKWLIDEGKIKNLVVERKDDYYLISFTNEAGRERLIKLQSRDIVLDGVNSSIDGAILNAIKQSGSLSKKTTNFIPDQAQGQVVLWTLAKFVTAFCLFVVMVFLIPGANLLRLFTKKIDSRCSYFFLTSIIGIVAFSLVAYLAGFTRLWVIVFIYVFLMSAIFIYQKSYRNILQINFSKGYLIFFGAVILGTAFQVIPVIKSGLLYKFGVGFWGPNAHDGIWHIALARQLLDSIPPQNPALSQVQLKNYHYFFDLVLAGAHHISGIPLSDLLFRFFPIFFSLLLGLGTFSLISILTHALADERKRRWIQIFSLFFVYSAGSFGWIVEYIKNKSFGGESDFWVNQSISFNLNPPFAVSILIVIGVFQLLFFVQQTQKFRLLFLVGVLSGVVLGFKAYAAVLLLLTLAALAIIETPKQRYYMLGTFILSVMIAFLIYLPNFNAQDFFVFSPFWFVHTMIDFPDRVGWIKLSSAREAYFAKNDFLKFFLIEALTLTIFITGNLGVRTIGFVTIFLKRKSESNYLNCSLAIFTLGTLIIPLLFIQKGNPWNTIQFFYYGLFLFALYAAIAVIHIGEKLPKRLFYPWLILVISFTPINAISTAKGYFYNRPHAFIPVDEIAGLNFLRDRKPGAVLSFPYNKANKDNYQEPYPLYIYETTAYISAYTNKPTFIADEIQQEILQTDYLKRKIAAKDFFSLNHADQKAFLQSLNIRYVYLPKQIKITLEEDNQIKKIFDNLDLLIYEYIP